MTSRGSVTRTPTLSCVAQDILVVVLLVATRKSIPLALLLDRASLSLSPPWFRWYTDENGLQRGGRLLAPVADIAHEKMRICFSVDAGGSYRGWLGNGWRDDLIIYILIGLIVTSCTIAWLAAMSSSGWHGEPEELECPVSIYLALDNFIAFSGIYWLKANANLVPSNASGVWKAEIAR